MSCDIIIPGDEVEVLENYVDAIHPETGHLLVPGDRIKIIDLSLSFPINNIALIYDCVGHHCQDKNKKLYNGKNWIPITSVRKIINSIENNLNCSCSISLLMISGCKCGAFKREQEMNYV